MYARYVGERGNVTFMCVRNGGGCSKLSFLNDVQIFQLEETTMEGEDDVRAGTIRTRNKIVFS